MRHEHVSLQDITVEFHAHDTEPKYALCVELSVPLPSDTPDEIKAFIIMKAMQAHLTEALPRLEKTCGINPGSVVAFLMPRDKKSNPRLN